MKFENYRKWLREHDFLFLGKNECENINATPEEIWNMAEWIVKREEERRGWEDYK